jgi:hypothetical protein
VQIPNEVPVLIQRAISASDPALFQSIGVALEDDGKFLIVSAALAPNAVSRLGPLTAYAARVIESVMRSYTPSPVPGDKWICQIAR